MMSGSNRRCDTSKCDGALPGSCEDKSRVSVPILRCSCDIHLFLLYKGLI